MVFSECGRYIYGTSSKFDTEVIEVDIWKAVLSPESASRVINFPDGMLAPLEGLTLSLWRGQLMLVGRAGSFIVAVRITPGPRASFSRSILAIAPSFAESATRFKAMWPDEVKQGSIIIIIQNGNQIRKDGKIGGETSWPFVLKVKEKDIGEWSEPYLEPEVEAEAEKEA